MQAHKLYDGLEKSSTQVLGLGDAETAVPAAVQALVDQRAEVRKAKDFSQSDALRKEIEKLGWKVKDTPRARSFRRFSL